MSSPKITPFLQAWYKWKAMRLPWRKQFLVGLDLHGNTYWEFRDVRGCDPAGGARWRRIVRYPAKTHYGDVKVPPAWHQWLRQLRPDPPSIAEQQAEVARQERLKHLAAQADARWAAKASLVDGPTKTNPTATTATLSQPAPPLKGPSMEIPTQQQQLGARMGGDVADVNAKGAGGSFEDVAATTADGATMPREKTWEKMLKEEQQQQQKQPQQQQQQKQQPQKANPWKQQQTQGGPSEQWQPKPWNPSPSQRN